MLKPAEIWDDEDLLLRHFFQIIQTKWCGLSRSDKPAPIHAYVGSVGELKRLAALLAKHLDGASLASIHLDIIYCDYKHLVDYSKSRWSREELMLESSRLRYEFANALTVHKATKLSFELYSAVETMSADPSCLAKIFSVPLSKQRGLILRSIGAGLAEQSRLGLASSSTASSPSSDGKDSKESKESLVWHSGQPMGKIGFDYSCFSDTPFIHDGDDIVGETDCLSSQALFFVQSPTPKEFVACILLP